MSLIAFLLASLVGAPSASPPTIGLPVGPGAPGKYPWAVAIWPNEGCAECKQSEQDAQDYTVARDALVSGDFKALDAAHVDVRVFSFSHHAYASKVSSLGEVHDRLKGCPIGAEGILKPNNTTGNIVSFGAGFDCPNVSDRLFVSFNFRNHRLSNLFLMDRPFFIAARTNG